MKGERLPVVKPEEWIKSGNRNLGHMTVEITTHPTVDIVVDCDRVLEWMDDLRRI